MPQRRNLLQPGGSHRRHRAMAQSIQHDPTALILELSAASTPNIHSPIAAPGSQLPDAIVSIPLVQNIRQVNYFRIMLNRDSLDSLHEQAIIFANDRLSESQ